MEMEKPLTPPSPPLSGGEGAAETSTTPSPDKGKVAPATFAIGRVGEGLTTPKYLHYDPKLTTFARANRKAPTPAETTIWHKLLRNRQFHGYKFLRQKPIGPYIVDFYCAELKLVIEIDGDSHAAQKAYDAQRTDFLNQRGIRVLRYTNLDVSQHLAGIYDDLTTHLNKHTS